MRALILTLLLLNGCHAAPLPPNAEASVKRYQLSGGGVVTVHKPFGGEHYVAVVEQKGRYPEGGKMARNQKRSEYSVVLDGTFSYSVDGKQSKLKSGDSILVGDGSTYSIDGEGRVLVVVYDLPGGRTVIE